MKWHPALVMVVVWALCASTYLILPFRLENRTMSSWGFILLAIFILVFVAGAFLASPGLPKRTLPFSQPLDFRLADRIIEAVTVIAVLAQVLDLLSGETLGLDAAFASRDERASGVLQGRETGGSLYFQIAFLAFPIGFCAIAREMLFRQRPKYLRLALLGFLPLVMTALAMGGRTPILYGIIVLGVCFQARSFTFPRQRRNLTTNQLLGRVVPSLVIFVGAAVAMNYFISVFVARANIVGGLEVMERVSAVTWGVSFDGPGSSSLRSVIGDGNMYLVYVFIWYLIQGLLMANTIFTDYDGGMTWGIYGLDLGSAVVRRIDPQLVSAKLAPLLDINVYGFLPSAFGSFYVDLSYFAVIPIFLWGYISGLVYRKANQTNDARWVFGGVFVTVGIIFSLINTPLGFGNGLIIHFWLLVLILVIRPPRQPVRATASNPLSH